MVSGRLRPFLRRWIAIIRDKGFQHTALLITILLAGSLLTVGVKSYGQHSHKVVVVFSGHSANLNFLGNHRGSKSVTGVYEFRYNDAVVNVINGKKETRMKYVTLPATLDIPLRSRPTLAEKLGASVVLEIHHDSVQSQIYSKLTGSAPPKEMVAHYRGFSLHVFPRDDSIKLAKSIESSMIGHGLRFSEYHQEDIPGERMKLVPGTKATYERTQLYLLRNSSVPTVIIECGCIANPEEEKLLSNPAYIQVIADAIHLGLLSYLEASG